MMRWHAAGGGSPRVHRCRGAGRASGFGLATALSSLAMLAGGCAEEPAQPEVVVPSTIRPADAEGSAVNDLPDVVEVTELPPLGSAVAPADEVIAVVHQYAEANGDVYAGKVLAGGRLWVGFTRDADGHLAELRSRLPAAGPPVGAFRASYSLRELRALQDEVTAAMSALRAEGVDVSVVGERASTTTACTSGFAGATPSMPHASWPAGTRSSAS